MSVYVVTGKLGAGKTLAMVGRLREYIAKGRPVATNIDLAAERVAELKPQAPIFRLPDRPSVADFDAIGHVHDTGREELNGAIVLDECGTWLNARTWADKERQAVIDWMLHSRKRGWDVYLIVQSLALLDKQVREALAEYVVICRRMDRVRIPFIGAWLKRLTFGLISGQLPQIHVAFVMYGSGPGAVLADRWFYRGRELWGTYRTTQVIRSDGDGLHCVRPLPAGKELAALERRIALRRKSPEVVAAMKLPPHRRIAVLKRVWLH